jgi:hypothetical protein
MRPVAPGETAAVEVTMPSRRALRNGTRGGGSGAEGSYPLKAQSRGDRTTARPPESRGAASRITRAMRSPCGSRGLQGGDDTTMSGTAHGSQAPRLPLAKHNGHYVSSGGQAPLLELSDAARLGARRETSRVLRTLLRTTPAMALWRADRLACCSALSPARPHAVRLGRR